MVKSTLERQQKLRRQRKKLGWKRKEFFVTDVEYAHLKEYLQHLRYTPKRCRDPKCPQADGPAHYHTDN